MIASVRVACRADQADSDDLTATSCQRAADDGPPEPVSWFALLPAGSDIASHVWLESRLHERPSRESARLTVLLSDFDVVLYSSLTAVYGMPDVEKHPLPVNQWPENDWSGERRRRNIDGATLTGVP